MKRLKRGAPPAYIDRTDDEARQRLQRWYQTGSETFHWNDKRGGTQPVRDAVRALSGDRCAWCEAALGTRLQVEHYLPQEHFTNLRFCWENFLPSCEACNKAKKTWIPKELEGRPLIDPVLATGESTDGIPYEPAAVLGPITDRFLEPTLDDPAEHLAFEPASISFRAKTPIGERTAALFTDKSWGTLFGKLFKFASMYVDPALEPHLKESLAMFGHETIVRTIIAYLRSFQAT